MGVSLFLACEFSDYTMTHLALYSQHRIGIRLSLSNVHGGHCLSTRRIIDVLSTMSVPDFSETVISASILISTGYSEVADTGHPVIFDRLYCREIP